MSEATLAKLFTKFSQADASTTRRFGGTGLGLAICRELASMMGGAIEAQSELGKGSTFTVTLAIPWVRAAGSGAGAGAVQDAGAIELEGAALRVLVAEDNPVNQLVIKTLLHQMGVDPQVVDNGVQAVEAWRTADFDIVLMDVQMPEMDGPTATRRIRELEAAEGRARTPILALTANVMAHQIAAYAEAGMDGHVPKPIDVAALAAAMEAALQPLQETPEQAAAS
jgi:CheY-like chemotaxis protein